MGLGDVYKRQTADTGMSCGAFGVGGTNKATKQVRVRAVLDNGDETATSTDDIIFTRADCSGGEDFPYLYQRAQSATSVNTGDSVTFTFRGDDSDSNGNADFAGINWRLRRSSDGTTSAVTKKCYSSPFDNTDKTLAVTFPDRGRWIVEAELLNNSGCNTNNNAGAWTYIGAVDVNTPAATSPTASLSATRPQLNGNTTVSATFADTSDSGDGGRVQNVEWDLDENTTNGVNGFETAELGSWTGLTSPRTKTINTTGMSPGLHTVRARVGDNGALVGADTIRRTNIATTTFLVDTPPVATDQSITARAGTEKSVTLAGTDADGDTLTYAVTGQPAHGLVGGSGANLTYTPDSNFAGTDTFTFTASDGFGGTDTGTVTVEVAPSTEIGQEAPGPIAVDNAEIPFSSAVAGATFECRLDPAQNPDWEACESPYAATGLSEGQHTFQVRATAAGLTDPTPAEHTFTVYLTPPDTTIDSGPQGPTAAEDPAFTFSSNVAGSTFECLLDTGDSSNQWEDCASPKVYDDLQDGVYTFNARATDPAGNVDGDPASVNFSIDNTAPDTTIDSGPPVLTNQTTADFAFSASEPGTEFECSLDGENFASCGSPQNYSGLASGEHEFQVRAVDGLGNDDDTPATFSWTIDASEPAITFTSTTPPVTNQTDVEFTFESDEPVEYECSVDGGDWEDCDSPATASVDDDGAHTFQVRGTDAAGNTGLSPLAEWELDRAGPETTIDSRPAASGNQPDVSFGFSSDEAGATFECRLDSTDDAEWAACTSPAQYTALSEGNHLFEVRAIDQAGNVDDTPDTADFEIDTTAPELTLDVTPPAESNSPNASFEFSSNDGGITFECRLDGAGSDAYEDCESPKAYLDLLEGAHTFDVRVRDEAGNRSEPETFEWTIDVTAPVTTISERPADPTAAGSATFEFDSDAPGSTFECRLDSIDDADWADCSSPQNYTGLSEGRHTFEVRATDQVGNVAAEPASWSWTVDQTAPQVLIDMAPPALTNQAQAEFTFGADEPATFECRVDPDGAGGWAECDYPFQTGTLAEGDHVVEFRATDLAGNVSEVASHAWEIDLTAPVATIGDKPDEATNQTTATFTFTADDAGAAFECRLDDGDWYSCESPEVFEALAEGEVTFDVRAYDAAGNTGPADRHEWRVILTPPTVAIDQGPPELSNSATANFTFSSNDQQATFECRLDSDEESGWESCDSPKQLTGLTDGGHSFDVRATDALGNTSEVASRDWMVDTTAPEVTIDAAPDLLVNVATATFEFSSTDNLPSFECEIDNGGWDECVSPKYYTGLSEGSHTFRVRATDLAGNTGAVDEHTWTVDLTDPEVTIDDGPAPLSTSATAEITFSADEQGTFECRIDSSEAADWAECDSPYQTGTLPEGDHSFEVRLTDAAGNVSGVEVHEWTIDLTAPVATITVAPPALVKSADATFEFTADDAEATFECRVDSTQENAWADCESPRDLTGLTDGDHVFEVRATDEAGNTGPVDTHEWTVDLVAPTVSITDEPEVLNNETTAVFEFESTDGEATFECRLDGQQNGDWEDCSSPAGYENLTEGEYTFRVRATDEAGNVGQEANHAWTVDLTAPGVTIDSTPDETTNSTAAEFEFSSDDQGTTFECRIDSDEDADWEACDSPKSYTALEDGSHLFEVRATDLAGNTAPESFAWTIDTEAPVATIDTAPGDPTNQKTATFEFSSDKPGSTFECRIDSDEAADWAACQTGVTYSGLEDGTHEFELRPTDSLGNVGEIVSSEWTIDTVVPVTMIQTGPAEQTSQKTAEFTFSADKSGSTFECRIDGDGAGGWSECDSGVSYSALADGDHRFEVRAIDAIGNVGQADEWTWTIDSAVPVATIDSGPEGPTTATSASFDFDADRTVAGFECRIDSDQESAWESCESPFTVEDLADGEHRFQVRAIGAISGTGPAATRVWTVDTVAPGVSVTSGPAASTKETGARFEFSSGDADAEFSCRIDSDLDADWEDCVSPRSLTGLPDGAHTFEVKATDPAGNSAVAKHDWTIDTKPPVITITGKPDASTTEQNAKFEFSADEQGATFECAVDGGTWGACTSPATIGPLGAGDHTFAVRASDQLGNASQPATHAWKITEQPGPGDPDPEQPAPAKPPVVTGMKQAKLSPAGKAKVASLFCAEGTCAVKAPKTVTVKIGKRKFKIKVVRPASIAAGKTAPLKIVLPKAAVKALGKRRLKAKIKVTITSSNGETVNRTINVKLRGSKGGKKK